MTPARIEGSRRYRFKRVTGPHSALFRDRATGRTVLASSSMPLETHDTAGHAAPTDLTLHETADGYAPVNSPTPIAIGRSVASGVAFPTGDFSIRSEGASSAPAIVDGRGVFFANTAADTDEIVTPQTYGASIDFQLRSPASPEREGLVVDLPPSAHLTRPPVDPEHGGIVPPSIEVERDGKALGYIYDPSAWDADGSPVPVHAVLEGNRIVEVVAHRNQGFRYPITVDPSILSAWYGWGGDWNGWGGVYAGGSQTAVSPGCDPNYHQNVVATLNNAAYSPGMFLALWNWDQAGGQYPYYCYGSGQANWFHWVTPASVYISSLYWYNFAHGSYYTQATGGLKNNGAWSSGLSFSGSTSAGNPWQFSGSYAGWTGTTCCSSAATDAYFGIISYPYTLYLGSTAPHPWVSMQSVTINLGDTIAPTVSASPQAVTNWTDDGSQSYYLPVTIGDAGLGAKSVTLSGAASGGGTITNGCTGEPYRSPCPSSATTAFYYTLPEGDTHPQLQAADVVGNQSGVLSWETKIDRTPPTLTTISGALKDSANKRIHEGQYPLHVEATDPYSGVQSIRIAVDTKTVGTSTSLGTCSGTGCSTRDWTLRPELYAEGPHTISVTATDNLGHTSPPQSWTVTVNHTADAAIGPGSVDLLSGNLRVSRDDVSIASYGSPLTVSRTYNSIDPTGGAAGPFGPGWVSSLPADDAGSDYTSVVPSGLTVPAAGDTAVLTDSDGDQAEFTSSGDGTYTAPAGWQDLKLTDATANGSITSFTLTDADGNVTTFQRAADAPAAATTFAPSNITQPGSGNAVTITWQTASNGTLRPVEISAPVPPTPTNEPLSARTADGMFAGPSLSQGNRVLDFAYATSTTATGTSSTGWGDFVDRLKEVDFKTYDPAAGAVTTTAVETYKYDSNGRLRSATDPRSGLTESYGYDVSGLLTSVTPAGQAAWSLSYVSMASADSDFGRLQSVSRQDPQLSAPSTWTVAYHVPVSGSAAPYDMSASAVAAWGQSSSEAPADATAIFPPDHAPAIAAPPSVSGLLGWWKADSIGATDGTPVASWTDASGNGHTLTQSTSSLQPIYRTGVVNGRPAVRHDGVDDFLGMSSEITTAKTVFVVASWRGAYGLLYRPILGDSATYDFHGSGGDGSALWYDPNVQPKISGGTTRINTQAVAFSSAHKPADGVFQILQVDTNGADQLHFDRTTKDRGSPERVWSGDYAEILAYDHVLSSTERHGIEQYLTQRYLGFSYTGATIRYFDSQGRAVNVASPNGGISTAEYDTNDNVTRSLTPRNRQRVLAGGSATQLDTERTYSSDGIDLVDEYGPAHVVQRPSGTQVTARRHTHVVYDQTAPAGSGPYHLPTTVTVSARLSDGSDADSRTTTYDYDYTVREPKTTVVDSGGLNLTSKAGYNSAGEVVHQTTPANPAGLDAHETDTVYYTADASAADAACQNRPYWANLVCETKPYAQPGTSGLPNLPVTTYTYDLYDDVKTKTEAFATGVSRTTTYAYDAAGRQTSKAIATSGESQPSTSVATASTAYDPATGLLATTSAGGQTVTRGYDQLGRLTSYTDAGGATSTTTYDIDGRPVTETDGKGTQTSSYDSTTGLLTQVADSQAGTFTAAYDADGQLTDEGLPGGLHKQLTYDETGVPTEVKYVKQTNCSSGCTWYDDTIVSSVFGQWLHQTSTLSSQDYTYDNAGRLTQVNDTPAGHGCTVRAYSFDADTNRLSSTSHDPATDGSCNPGSTGTTTSHSYDAGDRLTDGGVSYDDLGRQLSLPAADSGGGALSLSYFADDMARSVSQDGVSQTYTLDPLERDRTMQTTGSNGQLHTFHYGDDTDNPSWTVESTDGLSWTRNVTGVGGEISAIVSNTDTKLQVENVHGDVVATASSDPNATGISSSTTETDEFGIPRQPETGRYGWLGGKGRRSELASGVIQMGARTYVPALGRFTSPDPVPGGSCNAYDYACQDPVSAIDLDGARIACITTQECGITIHPPAQTPPSGPDLHRHIHVKTFDPSKLAPGNLGDGTVTSDRKGGKPGGKKGNRGGPGQAPTGPRSGSRNKPPPPDKKRDPGKGWIQNPNKRKT